MLCLSELCILVPKRSDTPALIQFHRKRGKLPAHLQAIAECLFSGILVGNSNTPDLNDTSILELVSTDFVKQLNSKFRVGVATYAKSIFGICGICNPFSLPVFCPSSSTRSEELICDDEVAWLQALSGSLDAYNFLITCLESCSGSELFTLPPQHVSDRSFIDLETPRSTLDEDTSTEKKRRRGDLVSDGNNPWPIAITGNILMNSVMRFFACCFHRLMRNRQQDKQLSSSPTHLSLHKEKTMNQEKLLAEVLRRCCLLITSLLSNEPAYFKSYLAAIGFFTSRNSSKHEFEISPFIQFVLMSALMPFQHNTRDVDVALSCLHHNDEDVNCSHAVASLHDFILNSEDNFRLSFESAQAAAMNAADSSIHQSLNVTCTTSYSLFPLFFCDKGRVTEGTYRGDNVGKFVEIDKHLPIALQKLFHVAKDFVCVLSPSLWSSQIALSMLSVAPRHLCRQSGKADMSGILAAEAFGKAIAILQQSDLLPSLFSGCHTQLLPKIGAHIVAAVFGSNALNEAKTNLLPSKCLHAPWKGNTDRASPTVIEVGNSLVKFAVSNLRLPVVDNSSSHSLLSIILREGIDAHHAELTTPSLLQADIIKNIDTYTDVLVDIFLRNGASSASEKGNSNSNFDDRHGNTAIEAIAKQYNGILSTCDASLSRASHLGICLRSLMQKILTGE